MKDQWVEWLEGKQRHFFYGVLLIVALFFIAFQMAGKFHKDAPKQSFSMNQAYEKWLLSGQAFEKIEEGLANHPELETKFGALIADRFIVQNMGDQAEPFAEKVFQRVMGDTPKHTAYAEGSLLIAKGNFLAALSQAVELKSRLGDQTLLGGFNMVRIASLYRALKDVDGEQGALEELDRFLQERSEAAFILSECFQEESTTLSDYISERRI